MTTNNETKIINTVGGGTLTVTPKDKPYNEAPNYASFAAIKADGSVVTWGYPRDGGDSSSVASQLDGTINVQQIYSIGNSFSALRADGSVVSWGYSMGYNTGYSSVSSQLDGSIDVKQIYSNGDAFAAIRADGSVVTWGYPDSGGDSSTVASQLDGSIDVVQICPLGNVAFAALRSDGSVVTWGEPEYGGDSSAVASSLNGDIDVKQLYSGGSFAALRTDGSVVTWGDAEEGGDSSAVANQLNGDVDVIKIYPTRYGAFAALRTDGSVVTWGDAEEGGGDSSAVASQLNGDVDVTQIYSNKEENAFAVLRADGSVVTWGDSDRGGYSGAVANQLNGDIDVTKIYSADTAFAALRADGSVVTWGVGAWGGDSSSVANQLDGSVDVVQIYSTRYSFAALRSDGSVATWGEDPFGRDAGKTITLPSDYATDITQIYSTSGAFAALRTDGSVVTWGGGEVGGDSSSVASQLNGDIDVTQIYSYDGAFVALRSDGSVVTWGSTGGEVDGKAYGVTGNVWTQVPVASYTSAVADQLKSDVVSLADVSTDDVYIAPKPINHEHNGTISINGNLIQDETLFIQNDLSDDDGLGTFNYQWLRNGKAISGATSDTYTLTANDVGKTIQAKISYTDGLGTLESESSVATDLIQAKIVEPTYTLTVDKKTVNETNNNKVVFKLATTNVEPETEVAFTFDGTISDTDVLGGLSTSSFVVDANGNATLPMQFVADKSTEGAEELTLILNDDNRQNVTVTVIDTSVEPVKTQHPHTGTIAIQGNAVEGETLWIQNELQDEDGLGSFKYQWLRDNKIISGATSDAYILTASDVGKTIQVKVNYTDGLEKLETETSLKTDLIQPQIVEVVTPTYTLSVDKTSVNEGGKAIFKLVTTNVESGTEVAFTLSGKISGTDVSGGLSTSRFVVDANGKATFPVQFLADKTTEGVESLTLTLNDDTTQKVSISVKDTSPGTGTTSGTVKIDGITKTAKSNAKDLLIGGDKNDSLTGLAGADTLRGNAGNDVLNGSLGNDSIEGGNGNDTLNGGDGNDKLIAGSGDDKLDGGKDNDTLDGGAGKDTLIGGAGVDSMTGGDGDDFYFVDNVKDKVVEINTNPSTGGKDTVTSNSATYTLGENIENLILEDLQGKGTSGAGNKGNNVITGSIGDNKLEGLAGNDTLIAGDGADTLDGGLGIDSLVGGNGDDLYMMNNIDDLIDEKPDGGIDHIIAAVTFNLGQSENVEWLTLSGAKAIEGTGNNLDNLIQEKTGGTTNNSISGGEGNDTLNGEGGNDTLEGGDGNDELNGGDGQDVAIFTGDYLDYLITINTDTEGVPQLIVEYKNESTGILDGMDILNDVEILEFADGDRHNKTDILQELGTIEMNSSAALIITGSENVE